MFIQGMFSITNREAKLALDNSWYQRVQAPQEKDFHPLNSILRVRLFHWWVTHNYQRQQTNQNNTTTTTNIQFQSQLCFLFTVWVAIAESAREICNVESVGNHCLRTCAGWLDRFKWFYFYSFINEANKQFHFFSSY